MFHIFQGSYRTSQFISTRSTCKLMHVMSVKSQYYDGDIFFSFLQSRGVFKHAGQGHVGSDRRDLVVGRTYGLAGPEEGPQGN